jgi:hypothetical protein
MAELRVWRRRHSPNIVSQVTPIEGIGTWDICVSSAVEGQEVRGAERFSLLSDALQAADRLAAATYQHHCVPACGVWEPVERRDLSNQRPRTGGRRATDG